MNQSPIQHFILILAKIDVVFAADYYLHFKIKKERKNIEQFTADIFGQAYTNHIIRDSREKILHSAIRLLRRGRKRDSKSKICSINLNLDKQKS